MRSGSIACVLCAACGSAPVREPAPPTPPHVPPALCARTAPIDRIAMRCLTTGRSFRSALGLPDDPPTILVSLRDGDGWHPTATESGTAMRVQTSHAPALHGPTPAFTPYENTTLDDGLARAVRRLCAGEWNPALYFQSTHIPEFGWPMDMCDGWSLVVGDGAERLELDRPGVPELVEAHWMLQIHRFGWSYVAACKPEQHRTRDGICLDAGVDPW